MPTVRLIDEIGQPREVSTKRVRSYWAASDTHLFHVHTELVDANAEGQHCIFLCSTCHSAASESDADPLGRSIAAQRTQGRYDRFRARWPRCLRRTF